MTGIKKQSVMICQLKINRREALDRARDSGKAAITSKIILVQEITEDKQAGFLIYLPIYKNEITVISMKKEEKI